MTLSRQLKEFQHSEWTLAGAIKNAQFSSLASILTCAFARVPYYRDTLGRAVYAPEVAVTPELWERLPILERSTLQALGEQLRTEPPPEHGRVAEVRTSGSTGRPVRVFKTELSTLLGGLLILREHEWHKRDYRGTLAAIRWFPDGVNPYPDGGSWPSWQGPIASLYETGKSYALSTTSTIAQQAEWLARVQPNYLMLYPSTIPGLIRECARQGVQLSSLRQLMTVGEQLDPSVRELCRNAWGVEIKDVYSAAEVGCIAIQCPENEHYHVMSENLLLEILRHDGTPCEVGEVGRVVVTPLHAFAMPLIRYAIGDYAELGGPCACGRGLPVLKRIHGRARNMAIFPDGRSCWPRLGELFYADIFPVKQFQVIQKTLTQLEVRLVADRPGSPEEEARLRALLVFRIGHPFDIDIVYVDEIPRGPTGKFNDFRCEVPHADSTPEAR